MNKILIFISVIAIILFGGCNANNKVSDKTTMQASTTGQRQKGAEEVCQEFLNALIKKDIKTINEVLSDKLNNNLNIKDSDYSLLKDVDVKDFSYKKSSDFNEDYPKFDVTLDVTKSKVDTIPEGKSEWTFWLYDGLYYFAKNKEQKEPDNEQVKFINNFLISVGYQGEFKNISDIDKNILADFIIIYTQQNISNDFLTPQELKDTAKKLFNIDNYSPTYSPQYNKEQNAYEHIGRGGSMLDTRNYSVSQSGNEFYVDMTFYGDRCSIIKAEVERFTFERIGEKYYLKSGKIIKKYGYNVWEMFD